MLEPLFKHDGCPNCKYLGTTLVPHAKNDDCPNGMVYADWYGCPQSGHPTIIARFSSDGPDYHSGWPNMATMHSDPFMLARQAMAKLFEALNA